MANYKVTADELAQVAQAIRNVNGENGIYKFPSQYVTKIESLGNLIENLNSTIEILTNEKTTLENRINQLEAEIEASEEEIVELESEIEELNDLIEDLMAQIEELEKSFEVVTITSSPITKFNQLITTIQALERGQTGYVLYIARALYNNDNSIVCFPVINGEYVRGAYCYRPSLTQGFNFYTLNYDDDRQFTIPAYATMLRVVLTYEVQ